MAVDPNMGFTIPDVGADGPEYAQDVNDALSTIGGHRHTGAGANDGLQLSQAALAITGDLELNDNRLVEVKGLKFQNQGTLQTGSANILMFQVSGSEAYWVPASGTPWKMTNGSGFNVTAFGGIGGDYTSTTASFNWSDVTKEFIGLQAASFPAKLRIGDVKLMPVVTGALFGTTLKTSGNLGANITFQVPGAVPSSDETTQVMVMTRRSATEAWMSGTNDLTFATLTASDVYVKDELMGGPSVGAPEWVIRNTGRVNFTSLTSSDAVFTNLTGTNCLLTTPEGDIRHSFRIYQVGAQSALPYSASFAAPGTVTAGSRYVADDGGGNGGYWESQTPGGSIETWTQTLKVQQGQTLINVVANVKDNGTIVRLKVFRYSAFGVKTKLAERNSGVSSADASLSGALIHTVQAGSTYVAEISTTGTLGRYYGLTYSVTRP